MDHEDDDASILEDISVGKYSVLKRIESCLPPHSMEEGESWVRAAISRSYEDVVMLLLKKGCKVSNKILTTGESPLHYAVRKNDLAMVQALLKNGAHPGATDDSGRTALLKAIRGGNTQFSNPTNVKIIDAILNRIETYPWSKEGLPKRGGLKIVHKVCLRDNLNALSGVIKKSAKVNRPTCPDSVFWPGYTPLHFAVEKQNLEMLQIILRRGADVNVQDAHGQTAIHVAFCFYNYYFSNYVRSTPVIIRPSLNILNTLLREHDKRLNLVDHAGLSTFHIACATNDPRLIKDFLGKCKDLDINEPCGDTATFKGYTPLHFAVRFECSYVAKILVEYGADINVKDASGQTPIHLGNNNGRKKGDIVDTIIGSSQIRKNFINPVDNDGFSHFHIACGREALSMTVSKFVKNKRVDVNQPVKKNSLYDPGYTALHLAVKKRCHKVAEILLNHGAHVNALAKDRVTPLYLAVLNNDEALTLRLLKAGADPNIKTKKGRAPLHIAAENGYFDLVNALLNYKADVNCLDEEDKLSVTPLHLAAFSKRFEIVELLIMHKANVHLRDEHGLTVLHYVVQKNEISNRLGYLSELAAYTRLIDMLLKKGVDINSQNRDGHSPLHTSAITLNMSASRVLLSLGADICLEDFKGVTPLEHSMMYYRLREHCALNHYAQPLLSIFPFKEFVETFTHHIAKLKLVNIKFSEKVEAKYHEINLQKKISNKQIWEERESIKAELEAMKRLQIDNHTSLGDILYKSPIRMACLHVKNDTLKQLLNSDDFNDTYQHYGSFIRLQYNKGLAIAPLIEPAKESMATLSNMYMPDYCVENIFEHLALEDLKNLILSTKPEFPVNISEKRLCPFSPPPVKPEPKCASCNRVNGFQCN